MELNETVMLDIQLHKELTRKPPICFEKMPVRNQFYTVSDKGKIFVKKINEIYDNFEIWDGVTTIKPVLPKEKKKEKGERAKKKNFILENMNKLKIPILNFLAKGPSLLPNKSEKSENSTNRSNLKHFKPSRSESKQPPTKLFPVKGKNLRDTQVVFNSNSKGEKYSSVKRSGTHQNLPPSSAKNDIQNRPKTTNFFITESSERKSSNGPGTKENSFRQLTKSVNETGEGESITGDIRSKTSSLRKRKVKNLSVHTKEIPKNVKFNIEGTQGKRHMSMFVIKSPGSLINVEKEENQKFTFRDKKIEDEENYLKSNLILSPEKTEISEQKETFVTEFINTNGIANTTEENFLKNKTEINFYGSKNNLVKNNRFLCKTPTKQFSQTHKNFFNKSLLKSSLPKRKIYSQCEFLTEENNKINEEIKLEKKFYDSKQYGFKEDYAALEKEQLRDSIPQKKIVGEIHMKGQKRYISKSKADIIRLSDSVSKMGALNVFKFYNVLNNKYEDFAKETELSDYEYERKKQVLKLEGDNMKQNNMKMKCLVENILHIHNKHSNEIKRKKKTD